MNALRFIARKLGLGFLYGCGFMLGIWFITIFVINNASLPLKPSIATSEIEGVRATPKRSNVEIASSKVITQPYQIEIIGTLVNNGELSAEFTEVTADLFDADGNFIYQCNTHLMVKIEAGDNVNFKVSCHGITKEIVHDYSTYKLRVGG